ncbi:MAG: hypothetical protein SGI73_19790 [Chloroflexota bacterium]|nr:hypothetical protein [Chloroflexota bacterium]
MMSLYRHGDVLIGQIDALLENTKKRGSVVLAYGEMAHLALDSRIGAGILERIPQGAESVAERLMKLPL